MNTELNGPRSLADAKRWMLDRLDKRIHPMGLTDVEPTRSVIEKLDGLDGESWSRVWMSQGDVYLAQAESAETSGDRSKAAALFYQAYAFYFMGRFPCPNHPGKEESYRRAASAYRHYGRLADPAIETIRLPFQGRAGEGNEIVAYLRMPERIERPPVIVMWGGVDAWKEEMTILTQDIARQGFATVALDNVGTGESPIKAGQDGERQFLTVFDWIEQSGRFDWGRMAIVGRSFGGHWATKLAHQMPDRFRAAVNWGGGIHYMFQPDWIEKSRYPDSYLMELVETRCRMLGASNDEEYRDGFRQLSLLDQGLLDRRCAPLLLVNGRNDTQCPNADIDLLLDHGDPKAVRLFPGGHMGFGPQTVPTIIDWIARQFSR